MKTIYLLEGTIGSWDDICTWNVCAFDDKERADAAAADRNEISAKVAVELEAFFSNNPEPNYDDARWDKWRATLDQIRSALPDSSTNMSPNSTVVDDYYDVPSYRVTEVSLVESE